MESTFRTGKSWTESAYVINVVETRLAPIAASLVVVFVLALIYVCVRRSRGVHEFTRMLLLVSSVTLAMLATSYSMTSLVGNMRTRVDGTLVYKNNMTLTLDVLERSLRELGANPFDMTVCSASALQTCMASNFYLNTTKNVNLSLVEITIIRSQIADFLPLDTQATLNTNLDMLEWGFQILQWTLNGLFVGIGTIVWLSILRKKEGRVWLHTVGGFLSFVCLLLGLGMLLGSHALADLCDDPMRTIAGLTSDADLQFYFNCTPNANSFGPFPAEFSNLTELLLAIEPVLGGIYQIICDEKCTCGCNKTILENVHNAIGHTFTPSALGVIGTFECRLPNLLLTGVTGSICSLFTPFVGYFFLLLSLSGHAMFLFYFVPKKDTSGAYAYS